MKKFLAEFKTFATKGNVIDLAVGVMIGAAFSSITTTLVGSVLMPLIGLFIGGIDIGSWVINIPNFIYGGDDIALGMGAFIMSVINFIIIALILFLMIKAMNKMRSKKEEAAPAAPSKEEVLLTEIRDIMKEKNS